MSFRLLGDALVCTDRVLCMKPEEAVNNGKAIAITFDTGQVVTIDSENPSAMIADYLTPRGRSVTNSTGTM